MAFAVIKVQKLLTRKNPDFSSYSTLLDKDEKYDLANPEFMIAFALDHWKEGPKDNKDFIHWAVTMHTVTELVTEEAQYPVHICTDEEFSRFYPIEDTAAKKVNGFQSKGKLLCFDAQKNVEKLYGSWRTDDSYTAIEPSLYPCATRIEFIDGSAEGGHDGCEWDEVAVQEYLGSAPTMMILYNQVTLNDRKYGDERLEKKASVHSFQISTSTGAYSEAFITKHEIEDETDFL